MNVVYCIFWKNELMKDNLKNIYLYDLRVIVLMFLNYMIRFYFVILILKVMYI